MKTLSNESSQVKSSQKLVATTVSSREVGVHRRNAPMTTRSHDVINKKKEDEKDETIGIHSSKSKDSQEVVLYERQKRHHKRKKKCDSRH